MKPELCVKECGVALTGGIASGKTFVADYLRELNFTVYDADVFAREVVKRGESAYEAILNHFGEEILLSDGEINRNSLGKIIFSSPKEREFLESVVHPAIHEKLFRSLKRDGILSEPRIWFYEAALIFEKERGEDFFQTWLVYCYRETQVKRLKARKPNLEISSIDSTLKSQMPFEDKKKKASFLISTDISKEEVRTKVDEGLSHLRKIWKKA